jgi:hypothetical protein
MNDILKVIGINSKGYGTFPKLIAQDLRLTIEAKGIYSYFCSYAGSGNIAFPSVSKILHDLNIGKTRYYKHFKLLIEFNYIKVEQVKDGTKFGHNVYELIQCINNEIPCNQNEYTEEKPCHRFGESENGESQNEDSNINNLNINNFKKEREKSIENELEKIFNDVEDASDTDYQNALDKLASSDGVKNVASWFRAVLMGEVSDRVMKEFAVQKSKDKPKTKKEIRSKEIADKYEKFYL